MGLPNSWVDMHSEDLAFQILTSWSSEPLARMCDVLGWKVTTQGVRLCPGRTFRQFPVLQQMILTVWSPCVDASISPSGLKAAAMVDRGGGFSLQYKPDMVFSISPSTQRGSALSLCRLVVVSLFARTENKVSLLALPCLFRHDALTSSSTSMSLVPSSLSSLFLFLAFRKLARPPLLDTTDMARTSSRNTQRPRLLPLSLSLRVRVRNPTGAERDKEREEKKKGKGVDPFRPRNETLPPPRSLGRLPLSLPLERGL
mmetsp:Transcript_36942/g.79931  ORF Transcript_36942/g.79931 Transcript_36942/m.79931 type:complete len:257 (+) Transcript_36942:1328-2098(+)